MKALMKTRLSLFAGKAYQCFWKTHVQAGLIRERNVREEAGVFTRRAMMDQAREGLCYRKWKLKPIPYGI